MAEEVLVNQPFVETFGNVPPPDVLSLVSGQPAMKAAQKYLGEGGWSHSKESVMIVELIHGKKEKSATKQVHCPFHLIACQSDLALAAFTCYYPPHSGEIIRISRSVSHPPISTLIVSLIKTQFLDQHSVEHVRWLV